jgi:predicted DsbA family dithiol-disulfide isomerase
MIEVFADIWCPFTHVGLTNVVAQLDARGRSDVAIYVRSWPLEWVNGRPMDPEAAREHAAELRAQVAPDAFADFDVAAFPHSTIPVLALIAGAYRLSTAAGQALSLEVRQMLFEQGRDVSDPAAITELADRAGTDVPGPDDYAAVVADWADGRLRGVKGSPHFFCGDVDVFCPSLEVARKEGGDKDINTNLHRLQEFLDRCLAPTSS